VTVLDTDRIRSDEAYREELRHRCETDHFFLAEVIGFTGFKKHLHQPAVDLYFPKNRNLPIEDQHPIKNRMHLDPRHTYKTTLGKIDTAQWIITFPEIITILNESATQPLAEGISKQVASFFWQQPGKAPTPLQLLYPEITTNSRNWPEGEWNTPNHSMLEMDRTLSFTSPKSTQSGWHPWIINPDDMVEGRNSGPNATDEARRNVIDTYFVNRNLLRHGGYVNIRGTRYHPEDLYGYILENSDPAEWKMLIRGSLLVKNEQRLLQGEFPEPEELVLLFPDLLPYEKLRSMFFENYQSFMSQQMNDPYGGMVPIFDEALYTSCLCTPDRIPVLGETFICWRLPYGDNEFAEGAAAHVFGGKVYVIDTWNGIYTPTRLVEKIVKMCKRHQTAKITIEASPGAEYIEAQLKNESYRRNHPIRVIWAEFDDDNTRRERMRQLEPVMRGGRLLVSTELSKAQETRRQFLRFSMVRENGIVDAISRLSARIPASVMREEIEEEEMEYQRYNRQNIMAQMAYGAAAESIQGGMEEANEKERLMREASGYAWEKANSWGLPPMPGGLDG
jgi:hypothetical protein